MTAVARGAATALGVPAPAAVATKAAVPPGRGSGGRGPPPRTDRPS